MRVNKCNERTPPEYIFLIIFITKQILHDISVKIRTLYSQQVSSHRGGITCMCTMVRGCWTPNQHIGDDSRSPSCSQSPLPVVEQRRSPGGSPKDLLSLMRASSAKFGSPKLSPRQRRGDSTRQPKQSVHAYEKSGRIDASGSPDYAAMRPHSPLAATYFSMSTMLAHEALSSTSSTQSARSPTQPTGVEIQLPISDLNHRKTHAETSGGSFSSVSVVHEQNNDTASHTETSGGLTNSVSAAHKQSNDDTLHTVTSVGLANNSPAFREQNSDGALNSADHVDAFKSDAEHDLQCTSSSESIEFPATCSDTPLVASTSLVGKGIPNLAHMIAANGSDSKVRNTLHGVSVLNATLLLVTL